MFFFTWKILGKSTCRKNKYPSNKIFKPELTWWPAPGPVQPPRHFSNCFFHPSRFEWPTSVEQVPSYTTPECPADSHAEPINRIKTMTSWKFHDRGIPVLFIVSYLEECVFAFTQFSAFVVCACQIHHNLNIVVLEKLAQAVLVLQISQTISIKIKIPNYISGIYTHVLTFENTIKISTQGRKFY